MEFVMKSQILFGMLICSAALLVAQPPPPAAFASAPVTTVTGSISQFNYGPDGRVGGFVMTPNTLVNLPPDWALQVEMLARTGSQAKVMGQLTPTVSGMQMVQPQSLEVAGKTLTLAVPSQPAPYAASGVIRSLNYGAQGEINGFVLQDGVIARTPRSEPVTFRSSGRERPSRFPVSREPPRRAERWLTCNPLQQMGRQLA